MYSYVIGYVFNLPNCPRFVDPNDEGSKGFIIFGGVMQNHILHVNIAKTVYTKLNQTKTITTDTLTVIKFVALPHHVHVKVIFNSTFSL